MLIDLSQAVGSYLTKSSLLQVRIGGLLLGFLAPGPVHHALRGAMDRLRAGRQERDADRVLVLLDRRRDPAVGLRALPRATRSSSLGQAFGVFVYARNLYFELRDRHAKVASVVRARVDGDRKRQDAQSACRFRATADPLFGGPAIRSFTFRDVAGSLRRTHAPIEAQSRVRDRRSDRRLLEPDVQAHRRAARRPLGGGAHAGAVERNGQALEAAPGGAHAEQGELVEKCMHRCLAQPA